MKHQGLSLSSTKGNSLVAQADNIYSAVQTAFKQKKIWKYNVIDWQNYELQMLYMKQQFAFSYLTAWYI